MKPYLFALASISSFALTLSAAPVTPDKLQLRVAYEVDTDLGRSSSCFNPVYDGSYVYVDQINSGAQGFARYYSGWGTPLMTGENPGTAEHRKVMPFPGALKNTYLLGSGSGITLSTNMSRYNFDGTGKVDANTPTSQTVEGFDWIDDTTIIHTSYTSGNRKNLFLLKVTAEPFSLERDTRWNANGYVGTTVTTRIRNVRVGDLYKKYAYYGDAGQVNNPKFCAINLETGVESVLGTVSTISSTTGSYGVWTVVERGGYLYVQTTDDGVQIYNMTSATSIGSLYATYTKGDLDAITGIATATQYWGFDVTPDGSRFLISTIGRVFEFGGPDLKLAIDAGNATLFWPSTVNGEYVQSAPTVTGPFTDLDPQPYIFPDGKTNLAVQIPVTTGNTFFRLRK